MPPHFRFEKNHEGIVAGIDEAGRGPWAGPVVVGIVIFDRGRRPPRGIDDSKQLCRERREELYHVIMERAVTTAIGVCTTEEVDSFNILGATKQAMRRAFDLLPLKPDHALVDGNQLPDLPCAMTPIIDGDALCISIAAASILAKVTRDRMMIALASEHPEYGWERNVGYGTKEHQAALAAHGVTKHHRRSFAPIRKLLGMDVAA